MSIKDRLLDLELNRDNQMDIVNCYVNKLEELSENKMVDSDIVLTDDKEVNNQLIVYFWWLILLSFFSQLIGYLIQLISGTIDITVFWILGLGSINTLLIGGGVKLVQKQMESVSNKYNESIKKAKTDDQRITALELSNAELLKQLNDRDSELIALKMSKEV